MKIETKIVKLSEIKLNPNNPRQISEKNMKYLIKSLQEFPEMMELREIVVDEKMMILGGNMRFLALQQIGEKECIAKIVAGLSPEQKREFVIKDNAAFGSWDMDLLSKLDDLPLIEWGVDIPKAWGMPPPEDENQDNSELEEPQIIICPECGHKFSVLKEKQ